MTYASKPFVALIIPVFNAEKDIPALFAGIGKQTLQPDIILVIDSSSTDNTRICLSQYKVILHTIPKQEFDHGGTRRLATQLINADIYIFITQDAYPATPLTFETLVAGLLMDKKIGCAYARQLPKEEANPISIHGRLFNYPEKNQIKCLTDKKKLGIKTCFNSDNLAAYKKEALEIVGGFPEKLLTGEDVCVAAKLLLHGYAINYMANATIYHSHNLSLNQEFHRYFSTGLFHRQENWIIKEFASANKEGLRFIHSEMRFLLRHKAYLWIPRAMISTFVKFVAYKMGYHAAYIPALLKRKWGINKSFWSKVS